MLQGYATLANLEAWNFIVTDKETIQFGEYKRGGFYNWHTDASANTKDDGSHRKLSVTLSLNDEDEFDTDLSTDEVGRTGDLAVFKLPRNALKLVPPPPPLAVVYEPPLICAVDCPPAPPGDVPEMIPSPGPPPPPPPPPPLFPLQ